MSAVSWLWMIRARVLAREEPAAERQESRVFFFEKKNQKTFTYCARFRLGPRQPVKSLLLLFFRKEDLSFLLNVLIRPDQIRNQPGPPRLMRSTQAPPRVAMKMFMKH
jgi:hypothetical protein